MTIEQKVNMAAAFKGVSQAHIARACGMHPANFNKRLSTGKFTSEELEKIAKALGASYEFAFIFPDGTKI